MTSGNGSGPHTDFDAIVVGGGHNGLTAAAYLARAGMRVCVLERRDLLGGACVTEEVWPGQRVSRASYVVSMLRPQVVKDLELKRFGYDPIPLDPPFGTFAADGTPILFHNDAKLAYESLARVSRHDADRMEAFEDAHAQARAREVRRRGQPVVAAADDDGVEVGGHRSASK